MDGGGATTPGVLELFLEEGGVLVLFLEEGGVLERLLGISDPSFFFRELSVGGAWVGVVSTCFNRGNILLLMESRRGCGGNIEVGVALGSVAGGNMKEFSFICSCSASSLSASS